MDDQKKIVIVKWTFIGLGFLAGMMVGVKAVDRLEKRRPVVWRG